MDVVLLVFVFAGGFATFVLLVAGWIRIARQAHAASKRSAFLRDRFGCEYVRAVALEGRVEGERALTARLARFDGWEHPALDAALRARYAEEWRAAAGAVSERPAARSSTQKRWS